MLLMLSNERLTPGTAGVKVGAMVGVNVWGGVEVKADVGVRVGDGGIVGVKVVVGVEVAVAEGIMVGVPVLVAANPKAWRTGKPIPLKITLTAAMIIKIKAIIANQTPRLC